MEWIKIKDRLPEHRQKVLICVDFKSLGQKSCEALFINHYTDQYKDWGPVFFKDSKNLFEPENVDYWMPWPELPEPTIK